MNTDVLGMALSINSTIPSTTAFVTLIRSLCKETSVSCVFGALRAGLLTKRYSIPTENWKNIIKQFDNIPKRKSSKSQKKETEENTSQIVPFEYFDEDYIPTDMVSNILKYLDTLSQCKVNTCLLCLLSLHTRPVNHLKIGKIWVHTSAKNKIHHR